MKSSDTRFRKDKSRPDKDEKTERKRHPLAWVGTVLSWMIALPAGVLAGTTALIILLLAIAPFFETGRDPLTSGATVLGETLERLQRPTAELGVEVAALQAQIEAEAQMMVAEHQGHVDRRFEVLAGHIRQQDRQLQSGLEAINLQLLPSLITGTMMEIGCIHERGGNTEARGSCVAAEDTRERVIHSRNALAEALPSIANEADIHALFGVDEAFMERAAARYARN